jgi:hypothetical protein
VSAVGIRGTQWWVGVVGVVCGVALLGLTGCGQPAVVEATPSASTDSAQLVEAIDVYTRYSAALDGVIARGDGDFTSLSDTTTEKFRGELELQDTFAQNGWKSEGATSFDSESLLVAEPLRMVLHLCRDVSRVRILDASGTEVTPPERSERFPVHVTLVRTDEELPWLIDGSVRDPEDESCV